MIKKKILTLAFLIAAYNFCFAQVVPITNYSVNSAGQAQLSIQGQAGRYYILTAQHSPTFTWATSMTMGINGTMVLSEGGSAYPEANYTVTEHNVATPDDIDGDGIDDITEFNNMPTNAPINFAPSCTFVNGATSIPDAQTFENLSIIHNVDYAPWLSGQRYLKFVILDRDSNQPKIYFINSNTHELHPEFTTAIGANVVGDDGSGEIVFYPNEILPNGVIGCYKFNFSIGEAMSFEDTQRTYELLLANMPFLQNNLQYFVGQAYEAQHNSQYAADFVGSRIEVNFESELFANVDYVPFHEAEGYGFFRHMTPNETAGSRDIVLYNALPNSLPRVGGIITSVMQTPLSHVNLRAIQDNVPNAYIKDPLLVDSINSLLGSYIYYKAANDHFEIREATITEVNDWYESIRPTEPQIPVRDLSITQIMPLDSIEFDMSSSFGAKCSNVATMRTFGFPNSTIPDGFGIPFYFYDEFMTYNNFYAEAQVMIDNPTFKTDLNFRIERLKMFRNSIKSAPMPQWMMDSLQAMHDGFPVGTAVRVRSSTNNEDLPGFSGAGLYSSKTQHLNEGHISKSVKQVYASMWNFRAFEERDFYRVDHLVAAMGLLCHPNFEGEKSNGVGVSIDPLYDTDSAFYLNTQVGESLITNPDPNAVPEEILLYQDSTQGAGYQVLKLSSLAAPGELIMDEIYLNQMREYLTTIHDEFAVLYDVVGAEGFGMDIEYKVTAQDSLAIKQARPWVSFWANIKADNDLSVAEIVNPQTSSALGNNELVTARIANTRLNDMEDFDISLIVDGQQIETLSISDTIQPFNYADYQFSVAQDFSTIGDYNIRCIMSDTSDQYANNDTLDFVLSKIHVLDGSISIGQLVVNCDDQIDADITIVNHGDSTITSIEIEIVVNGMIVGTQILTLDLPTNGQGTATINISNNLQPTNNTITFNILSVNGLSDGDLTNNSVSTTTDLDSDYNTITLNITPDDWPEDVSWELVDNGTNQTVASGALQAGMSSYSEAICVDYSSCFSLYVRDVFGDGICCSYGNGNFQVVDASGQTIVTNNGQFGAEAHETFCPDGTGCAITANINVTNTTSTSNTDGIISIYTSSGVSPFQYSINGGSTLIDTNVFEGLAAGNYDVFIQGATGNCTYQETVTIEACEFTSVDIQVTHAFSTTTTDGSIVITPMSGVGPYLYSIDGGQNFVSTNTFTNLPVGPYTVVVKDASNVCVYEAFSPIVVEGTQGIADNFLVHKINVYPNPTSDKITIEIESLSNLSEPINLAVYDFLGRQIQTDVISEANSGKTTISLNGYSSGNYFVKCYNNSFEKRFKVIKM